MKILTIGKIIFRIALIIAIVEVIIMLIIGNIPHAMNGEKLLTSYIALLSFLNALLLVLIASPLIYFWVVKPYVVERNEAINKVTLLAHYDPLTHLANRRLINQNLKILMAHCSRHDVFGALLLIDLDKFKPINDKYGHDAGDKILVEIAKRLSLAIRDDDVAGRIGGDEFVVLISHIDKNQKLAEEKINNIAKKLHAIVNAPMVYRNQTLQVGSSIGIALLGADTITMETVFKRADIAMYQAKKNTVKHVIFKT